MAYIDMEDRLILGDVKSAPKAYFTNTAQLGGYHMQLEENGMLDEQGGTLGSLDRPIQGHAIFHFGGGFTKPSITYSVDRSKRSFVSAMELYKDNESFEEEFKAAV